MKKRRILLAVSTSRYSRHLVDHTLHESARFREQGDEVIIDVLYVIEKDDLARVGQVVGDDGFLGVSPQQGVIDALGAEHNRMALKRVDEVRIEARRHELQVNVVRVKGRFVDQVLEHADRLKSDVILVTRAERPFISRILFGSECDRVARLARRDGLGQVIIDDPR